MTIFFLPISITLFYRTYVSGSTLWGYQVWEAARVLAHTELLRRSHYNQPGVHSEVFPGVTQANSGTVFVGSHTGTLAELRLQTVFTSPVCEAFFFLHLLQLLGRCNTTVETSTQNKNSKGHPQTMSCAPALKLSDRPKMSDWCSQHHILLSAVEGTLMLIFVFSSTSQTRQAVSF